MAEDLSEKRKKLAEALEEKQKNESPSTKKFRVMREQVTYAKNDTKEVSRDKMVHLSFDLGDVAKKYNLELSRETPLKGPMGAKDVVRSIATADEYFRKGKTKEAAIALISTAANYDRGMILKTSLIGQRTETGYEKFPPSYRYLEPGETPVKLFESMERRAIRYANRLGTKDPTLTKTLLMLAEQIEKKIEPYKKKK